jgi:hypothetical protein
MPRESGIYFTEHSPCGYRPKKLDELIQPEHYPKVSLGEIARKDSIMFQLEKLTKSFWFGK